jgi:hypothetical protein
MIFALSGSWQGSQPGRDLRSRPFLILGSPGPRRLCLEPGSDESMAVPVPAGI